jgi:hypothetical protein
MAREVGYKVVSSTPEKTAKQSTNEKYEWIKQASR